MRTVVTLLGILALALVPVVLVAADVSGCWEGEYKTFDGAVGHSTFTFRQSGEQLTGTVTGDAGDVEIEEGKVTGDTVSFSVTRQLARRAMKLTYTGTVKGDEMTLKASFPGAERGMTITAKRAGAPRSE